MLAHNNEIRFLNELHVYVKQFNETVQLWLILIFVLF